jgi:glycosyltransferase involved in cell wall biosynthesis
VRTAQSFRYRASVLTGRDGISVILPTRNSVRWLGDSLESLITQTKPADEILVVDDNSSDGTLELVRDLRLPGLRVVQGPGTGLANALRLGVLEASFEFVARQDADDISLPTRLERQSEFLVGRPEVVVVGSAAIQVDVSGRGERLMTTRTRPEELRFEACLWNPLLHPTVMMRRSAVLAAGNYRSPSSAPFPEDYDLWVRLLRVGELAALEDPLVEYRFNPDGLTLSNETQIRAHASRVGAVAAEQLLGYRLSASDDALREMFLSRNRKITMAEWLRVERLLLRLRQQAGVTGPQLGTAIGTYLRPLRWLLMEPQRD